MDNFAQRLAEALEDSGMNQKELGVAVGKDKQIINQYLSGKNRETKASMVFVMADVLAVSPRWLATGIGNKKEDAASISKREFIKCYDLFSDAVLMAELDIPIDKQAQCLIEMYNAEISNKSPFAAMSQVLVSKS